MPKPVWLATNFRNAKTCRTHDPLAFDLDGISQTGELQTLNTQDISCIGVAGTSTNVNLGNGYTGHTTEALALPQMQGAGRVRGWHSAMSLGTVQAGELQPAVGVFAAGSSRSGSGWRGGGVAGCERIFKQKMAVPLVISGFLAIKFKSSNA